MRPATVLALLLSAGACEDRRHEAQPQVADAAQVNATAAAEPPLPMLLRYQPPERGGPEAFRDSQVLGVLDMAGSCVRLQDGQGRYRIVVTSAGTRLGRDPAGLYLQSGQERLRHGSSAVGGGGELPDVPLGLIQGPVPAVCSSGRAVEMVAMRRYDPPDEPPAAPPPPPALLMHLAAAGPSRRRPAARCASAGGSRSGNRR